MNEFMSTSSKLVPSLIGGGGGDNYVEWKYLVEVGFREMFKDGHVIDRCPADLEVAAKWTMKDKHIRELR